MSPATLLNAYAEAVGRSAVAFSDASHAVDTDSAADAERGFTAHQHYRALATRLRARLLFQYEHGSSRVALLRIRRYARERLYTGQRYDIERVIALALGEAPPREPPEMPERPV